MANPWGATSSTLRPDYITAPELAVDGEIEHRQITKSTTNLQHRPDRPDVFRPQRRFGTKQLALVLGVQRGGSMCRHAAGICFWGTPVASLAVNSDNVSV